MTVGVNVYVVKVLDNALDWKVPDVVTLPMSGWFPAFANRSTLKLPLAGALPSVAAKLTDEIEPVTGLVKESLRYPALLA